MGHDSYGGFVGLRATLYIIRLYLKENFQKFLKNSTQRVYGEKQS
jgi:hypothetical protein